MSVRAAAVMLSIAVFTISASPILRTCCTRAGEVADVDWLHQEASITTLVVSMVVLLDSGRMACWSAGIGAADAKKAEVASVCFHAH